MTYQDYLETWEDNFGTAGSGEFTYWHYGREMKTTLPKMTESQFIETLARFDELGPKINQLQKRDDYATNPAVFNEVDRLLAESFKCELPLFF